MEGEAKIYLQWLYEKRLFRTLIAMEEETGMSLQNCSADILVLRSLCFQGKFEPLSELLTQILPQDSSLHAACLRQHLKELLSSVDSDSDVATFIERLSFAKKYITREEKREFESALTAEDPENEPLLSNWSMWEGRYELFVQIANQLAFDFPVTLEKNEEQISPYSTPPSSLDELVSVSKNLVKVAEYMDDSSQPIRAVSFSPDGKYLAVGTNSQSLIVCEVDKKLKPIGKSLKLHAGSVYTCAWSLDGEWIATGSNDQTIRINPSGRLLGKSIDRTGSRIPLQAGTVRALSYLDANSLVCGSSADCTLRVIDPSNSVVKLKIVPYYSEGHVTSVDCSTESSPLICAASSQGNVWVSDPRAPPEEKIFWQAPSSAGSSSSVAAMRGTTLVAGNDAGDLILWDIRSPLTAVWKQEGLHAGPIRGVDFSPNKKSILSVSFDTLGKITETLSGDLQASLEGHSDKVVGAAWRNSSAYLATCGTDSRVILWSAAASNFN